MTAACLCRYEFAVPRYRAMRFHKTFTSRRPRRNSWIAVGASVFGFFADVSLSWRRLRRRENCGHSRSRQFDPAQRRSERRREKVFQPACTHTKSGYAIDRDAGQPVLCDISRARPCGVRALGNWNPVPGTGSRAPAFHSRHRGKARTHGNASTRPRLHHGARARNACHLG